MDYGTGQQSEEQATHALCMMVVAVNGNFKIPIAHFFTSTINGKDLANLVTLGVENINMTGAVLVNIVSDNASSNVTMLHVLGAQITNPDKLKVTTDLINIIGEAIRVVIDPSHIIKLVRNFLGDMKICFSENGKIEWRYIQQLQAAQETNHLHLANCIKKKHILYHKQKMKVYLATQVISESVAKAIELCDKHLHIHEFKNSEETCKFLRTFSRGFKLLDSDRPFLNDKKPPLKKENKEIWTRDFENIKKYVLSLREAAK